MGVADFGVELLSHPPTIVSRVKRRGGIDRRSSSNALLREERGNGLALALDPRAEGGRGLRTDGNNCIAYWVDELCALARVHWRECT